MQDAGKVDALRRKAVITAAFCAMMGGFIPVFVRGHHWLAGVCIGVQVVLLVVALNFYAQSRKAA
jgi:hypothetical protein